MECKRFITWGEMEGLLDVVAYAYATDYYSQHGTEAPEDAVTNYARDKVASYCDYYDISLIME